MDCREILELLGLSAKVWLRSKELFSRRSEPLVFDDRKQIFEVTKRG
jgi:hypothetical protein